MSTKLISHSPDLRRLRDDGYEIVVNDGCLCVRHVPYVDGNKQVRFGTLACPLNLAGDVTAAPNDHTIYFAGETPCNESGTRLNIIADSNKQTLGGVAVDHRFSCKPQPTGQYADYYAKITTYVDILGGPAAVIEPDATATTFKVAAVEDEESVFNYVDTASSRVGIDAVSAKLALPKVAVVGLGGTGSYVLDLIAKTPVREIHIFDGDWFFQHNAFRAPGAPSLVDLIEQLKKVAYHARNYAKMHRHIIPHDYYLDGANSSELRDMDFVFLCMDGSAAKKALIDDLQQWGIPFVDAGMGVLMVDGSLTGLLRVTTSTDKKPDHVTARVSFATDDGPNDYERNIQVADLNAFNAAMAVMKWKKLLGFYADLEGEHHTAFSIDGNLMTNDDHV